VWDYAGDGYVHRLIQSKSDGIVQLPPPPAPMQQQIQTTRRDGLDTRSPNSLITPNDTMVAEKVEGLGLEYASMLHSQLNTQRNWYENKMGKIESSSTDYICRLVADNDVLKRRNSTLEHSLIQMQKDYEAQGHKIDSMHQRFESFVFKYQNVERELGDERILNSNLSSNMNYLTGQLAEKDKSIKGLEKSVIDLKDQVRDLMFFLETQSKVAGGEIDGASVVGIEPAPLPTPSPKGKGRRKR
jgi:BRCA1-associated protein